MSRDIKNSLFGLGGFLFPTLVMLLSYPVLINTLGTETLGVYILSTTLSGAWALLDFGVAAATLKFVAEYIDNKEVGKASDVVMTSLVFYSVLGIVGASSIWIFAPNLVGLLSVEHKYQQDAIWAFRISGIRFAFFFINMVFISLLKAFHRFDLSTYILTFLSVITFGGAALGAALFDFDLVGISVMGLIGNIATVIVSVVITLNLCKKNDFHFGSGKVNYSTFKKIFGYGSFMALNGLAYTLTNQLQRFLVSIYLGPTAVTAFAIATTLIIKAQQALLAASEFIVPWVAGLSCSEQSIKDEKIKKLCIKGTIISSIVGVIGAICIINLGPLLIPLWLGSDVDFQIIEVLRVLAFGFMAWSIIPVGYHLLNGVGRPHINTTFLLVNTLILYIIIIYQVRDGASLSDFSFAQSTTMIIAGIVYLLFVISFYLRGSMPFIKLQKSND